jgi:Xaa-Pro aminopeptidase
MNDGEKSASHDTDTPDNLVRFMIEHWEAPKRAPMPPLAHAPRCRARRDALSTLFPGDLLVVPNGHLKVRANDEHYPFRASSDFYYLTGNQEPDCVLVMVPGDGGGHDAVLFVEPNPGKTDKSFFTDRVKGELWEGARLGVPESRDHYAIADTRSLADLETFVRGVVAAHPRLRVLRGHSQPLEASIARSDPEQAKRDELLATALGEMRLVKDEHEIGELRAAIDATRRGFDDVIARMRHAEGERELEGTFFTRARMEGNATGYRTIVAAGQHACTLHWRKNDGPLRKGELLLLDAGVEGHGLYTADITRTLPIDGKFTEAQRTLYELVLAAHAAAMAQVRPGNDFMEPNRAAMRVLAEGLHRLGIMRATAEEALRGENQFFRRYSHHNVSNMLGLDVHDCAKARAQTYKYGKLRPGMVLTIEPGLYMQPDDATVPAHYRGIGVRIEDDLLVTDQGFEVLSDGFPRTVAGVEKWIQDVWACSDR